MTNTPFLITCILNAVLGSPLNNDILKIDFGNNPDKHQPLIIGHRGASGYVPEHTLASYSLAILMGADYIEPDLVMTKDGYLVSRHDNELGKTTNVAKHPEFSNRYKNQTVDGIELSGWFSEDFTLEELKTLQAVERIPNIRPGNSRLDGVFEIPTLQEIIDLLKNMEISQHRTIGIFPEIKHSTHFKLLGLSMERALLNLLYKNGYSGSDDPVFIQSFEVSNLKEIKAISTFRLLQLYDEKDARPFDQVEQGTNLTYGDMATPRGLSEVAKYANAVGPEKKYIITCDENNRLGTVTRFVNDAHAAGLKVYPYTFRAENEFLPTEYQSNNNSASLGNLTEEIKKYLDTGIDGLFCDHPNIAISIRKSNSLQSSS